eukprot:2748018-Karenia_brevis.AAC.1
MRATKDVWGCPRVICGWCGDIHQCEEVGADTNASPVLFDASPKQSLSSTRIFEAGTENDAAPALFCC